MKRGRQELFQHQIDGVETIVHSLQSAQIDGNPTRAFLLHDEMGLGKTLQAIESARRLNLTHPILVVCPASCEHVWKNDMFKVYSYKNFKTDGMVVISYDMLRNLYKSYISEKIPQGALSNDELIRYCNIHNKPVAERTKFLTGDNLRRELLDMSRTIFFKKGTGRTSSSTSFMRQTWGLLILDEIHRIRSPTSITTKAVGFIGATYRLGLSGTPIVNSGHDLLCIWKYGLGLYNLDWSTINNNPNSQYCKDIIDIISLGRRKDNVQGLPLPKRDKTQEDVVFEWNDDLDQKRAYVNIKTDSLAYLKSFQTIQRRKDETDQEFSRRRMSMQQTFLGRMQKLRQVCLYKDLPRIMKGETPSCYSHPWTPASHQSFPKWIRDCIFSLLGGIQHRYPLIPRAARNRIIAYFVAQETRLIVPSPKMVYIYNMLRAYPTEKMVVFSTFRVFLEKVMFKWLRQIGIKSTVFCGGSKAQQQRALEAFEKDPELRVLLVVKGAGSEGLNLVSASICIIMDPHFNAAMDEQAAQRIDRIGQTKESVIIRRLYMRGSVDEAMKMLQQDKQGDAKSWSGNTGMRSLKTQGLFLAKRDTV